MAKQKTELKHVKDGANFSRSKTSKVTYQVIKKELDHIVVTSNNSNKSLNLWPGTIVFIEA